MSQLDILRYPDPRLHKVARPVAAVDDRIRRLVDDMLETMYAAEGVGLAATQVDVHERVIVIDTSEARDEPIVLINPELADKSDDVAPVVGEEVAGLPLRARQRAGEQRRPAPDALDRSGERRELDAEGLLSIAVQHEMDHLLGKVFVEYLSPLKRTRIKTRMLKKSRDEAKV